MHPPGLPHPQNVGVSPPEGSVPPPGGGDALVVLLPTDCDVIAGRHVQGVRFEGSERSHRNSGSGTLQVRHISHIRQ